MLLLVGLGNPGTKYEKNRHNVGFMAVDAIIRRHGFSAGRQKFHGLITDGTLDGHKVVILKPMTYMNESGQAVSEALNFYKLSPADVVVLYDELDLAPGKVRVKTGGGLAGHNGLKSIARHIGPDFKRVRIGIGHPGDKARVHGHVLGDFSKADQSWVEPLLDAIADAAPLLAQGKDGEFMNRLHRALAPEKPAKDQEAGGAASSAKNQKGSE